MRTVETQVFQYDELSEAAKAKAREWWRDGDFFPWHHENRQSLESFCDAFPVEVRRWSYDQWSYDTDCRFSWDDETPGDVLEGVRLRTYLLNNYSSLLFTQGVYTMQRQDGTFASRVSKLKEVELNCHLTGYDMDETLLLPIREFIRSPKAGVTFEDLLEACIDAWGRACRDDMAYYYSDESAEENIRANEYEFTEDGSVF